MKTKLFILTICIALVSLGASAKIKEGKALTGNSLTEFGKYTITVSDEPMIIASEAVKTYDLMYENTGNPIRVGLVKEEQCTTFVVRSGDFEIQYSCNKGVFGVNKIESRFQTLPTEEMDAKLNKVNFFSQRVISANKKSEEELLGLIACYFPVLVNEKYQASF